jgi:alpha-glucosidase
MEFLKAVPTEWKATVPIEAKVSDYVAIARQAKNDDWYIGAMTDWTARKLDIRLSFLPVGSYKMLVWKDGINADRNAKDFKMETISVTIDSTITISMAKGGGYVARIIKG